MSEPMAILDHIARQKVIFWSLSNLLKFFEKCVDIIFGLKKPTFGRIFSSKG